MASDQQTIEALQQENQRLREQIAVISHERDLCQQQTTTSDITAHVLHPFLDGPVVLFKWDAREGWPVEYVSLNVARFGYTADDFLSGRVPYPTIVYPEDLERVGNEVATYSAEGRAFFEQEYRLLNADGEPRWIYDYTSIIRDSAGTVTHYVGYILDITERKQTGEALQWSQKLLQHVLDSVPAVAYVKDRNGQYMLVNQQYLRLFHLTPEQIIGKTDHDISPPDIATALQRNDQ